MRLSLSNPYLLATVVTVVAAAWLLSGRITSQPTEAPAPPANAATAGAEAELRSVRVRTSVAEPLQQTVRVLGHTEAVRKISLRVELDSRVVDLPVPRGAQVKQGDLVARLAVDDRAAKLQEAKAWLNQRKVELDAARQLQKRGFRSEMSLSEAEAKLETARATVARMEIELKLTEIRAPFDGVVEERPVELGSYVKIGDTIANLVDLDPLRIVGHVSEREIGRVAPGAEGSAVFADGRRVEGKVAFVGSTADLPTRTFKVELEVPNPDHSLVAGLTVELRLATGTRLVHRASPALLALGADGQVGVKIVDDSGTVRFLPVAVAGDSVDGVWLAGLPEKVTLITVGQEFVREGQKVRPVAEGTEPTVAGR